MLEARKAPPSGVLELFYGVLFAPARTFEEADLARASGAGVAALVSVAVSGAFVVAGPQAWALLAAFLGLLALLGVAWFFNSAQSFLMARALHHTGDWAPLGSAIALGMLPWVFVSPLFALARGGQGALAAIGLVALAIWAGRVHQAAVRGATGLAARQATRLLLATAVVGVGLPTLSLLAYFLLLVGALGRNF